VLEEMKKSVDTNPEYKAMFPWLFGMEMDRDAAENFISTVESRAKLDSDLEGLVSLLLFHPAAIGNPAGLVSGDFLRKYDFSEHPKAKGLHGWVRYPAHWQMVEGNMPSVVVRFVSPRDGAMFFINVVNLPEEANDDDLKSLFNDDDALASFASNGKITEKRIVDLVGQKAIEFRTNIVNDTPLTKLYMQNIVYLTCYKTWLLIINGVVVTMNDEDCKTGMQNNLPLLQYLATMCGINRH
ncbi:MAG: hypothetical protein PHV05_06670, partial [Candidatus Riflebacteria bacterium]|nr:hypothetical protein [Candidatus Riflebacteria bacterium]